jgi:hypothetical protein
MRRNRSASAMGIALLLAACGGDDAEQGAPDRDAFGREWTALYETTTQSEAVMALRVLRERWLGRRVAWEVQIIESFCRDGACNVRAFDFARLPAAARTAIGGALPRVELGAQGFRALTRQCLAHGARCVARLEARLSEIPEDTDVPLRLTLTDVRLVEVRGARADEQFERVVRPRMMRRASGQSIQPGRS